jgi:hypothetical protein
MRRVSNREEALEVSELIKRQRLTIESSQVNDDRNAHRS